MRYWAYFAAKLAVAGAVLYGLLILTVIPIRRARLALRASSPAVAQPAPDRRAMPLVHRAPIQPPVIILPDSETDIDGLNPGLTPESADGRALRKLLAPFDTGTIRLFTNLALLGWFALAVGAVYFIIVDQRYRCRVCLRRLRMPVETGSWSHMLQLGRPRVEWICAYGHGTLRADEVQISGLAAPEWTPQSGDIWAELCAPIVKDEPE